MQRQTEEENATAEAEQLHLQEEEWNMAELERIQEQQVNPLLCCSALVTVFVLVGLLLLVCSQHTWL